MSNNGWDTYSKLVLQQLETMASGIEGLRSELQHVKEQLSELRACSRFKSVERKNG